jgi:hypothetical protein
MLTISSTTGELVWENGNVGVLEFKRGLEGLEGSSEILGEFMDVATAVLLLMVERAKMRRGFWG